MFSTGTTRADIEAVFVDAGEAFPEPVTKEDLHSIGYLETTLDYQAILNDTSQIIIYRKKGTGFKTNWNIATFYDENDSLVQMKVGNYQITDTYFKDKAKYTKRGMNVNNIGNHID